MTRQHRAGDQRADREPGKALNGADREGRARTGSVWIRRPIGVAARRIPRTTLRTGRLGCGATAAIGWRASPGHRPAFLSRLACERNTATGLVSKIDTRPNSWFTSSRWFIE
jgi:hypothetical protein